MILKSVFFLSIFFGGFNHFAIAQNEPKLEGTWSVGCYYEEGDDFSLTLSLGFDQGKVMKSIQIFDDKKCKKPAFGDIRRGTYIVGEVSKISGATDIDFIFDDPENQTELNIFKIEDKVLYLGTGSDSQRAEELDRSIPFKYYKKNGDE